MSNRYRTIIALLSLGALTYWSPLSVAAIIHLTISGEFYYDDSFSSSDANFAVLSGSFNWNDQTQEIFDLDITATHYCDGADSGCDFEFSASGGGWASSFVTSSVSAADLSGPDGDLTVDRTSSSRYSDDDGLGSIVFDAFQRYSGSVANNGSSGGPENMTETYFVNGAPVQLTGFYELSSAAVVPAPGAVWLFGSALVGLVSTKRK